MSSNEQDIMSASDKKRENYAYLYLRILILLLGLIMFMPIGRLPSALCA